MRKLILTDKQIEFIRQNRLTISGSDMAEMFGVGKSVVNRYISKNGLSVPRETVLKFRAAALIGKTTFTKKEDDLIRNEYLNMPIKVLAEKMGRSFTGVMGRLKVMGLHLSDEIRKQRKASNMYHKGDTPKNKGKRQAEFMSAEGIERTKKTRFQAGSLPHNTRADFDISIRRDKRGVSYKHIRAKLGTWIPLHRYNWQQVNGAIPPKMKLIFKDGDTMNCDISNLELLTPADLMKRNSVHNLPKPIAQVVQLRGALNRQINKHIKNLKA